jgi:hypothetical protein
MVKPVIDLVVGHAGPPFDQEYVLGRSFKAGSVVEIGGFDHQRIALPIVARNRNRRGPSGRATRHSTRALVPWIEVAELQAIHCIGVLLGEEPGALLNELTRTKPFPMVQSLSSRPCDPFW